MDHSLKVKVKTKNVDTMNYYEFQCIVYSLKFSKLEARFHSQQRKARIAGCGCFSLIPVISLDLPLWCILKDTPPPCMFRVPRSSRYIFNHKLIMSWRIKLKLFGFSHLIQSYNNKLRLFTKLVINIF